MKILSPACSTVSSPSMIVPQLMSHVVGHTVVDGCVGGDFERWRWFAAEDGAAACGEADDVGSAGYLTGGGDGIEAGESMKTRPGGVDGFGVEVDIVEVGGAALGDCAEGLFQDGGEAAGLVAGLGVVVDGAAVAGGVLLPPVDAVDEALGDFGARGAASEEMFGAVDFRGFGEDGGAAVADEDVDCGA